VDGLSRLVTAASGPGRSGGEGRLRASDTEAESGIAAPGATVLATARNSAKKTLMIPYLSPESPPAAR